MQKSGAESDEALYDVLITPLASRPKSTVLHRGRRWRVQTTSRTPSRRGCSDDCAIRVRCPARNWLAAWIYRVLGYWSELEARPAAGLVCEAQIDRDEPQPDTELRTPSPTSRWTEQPARSARSGRESSNGRRAGHKLRPGGPVAVKRRPPHRHGGSDRDRT
jgi:hypothetical protein